jgi:F-type H+-transporting ATPase subunit a
VIPLTASGETFEAPGTYDFWQPLIGDGAFAITRAMVVFAVTALFITAYAVRGSRNLSVVPTKRQFLVEGTYNLVRNSLGRDIIGSKDFKPFLPLLFSLFIVLVVNNMYEVLVPVQFPTFSRIGFPIVLAAVVYLVYIGVGIRRKGFIGSLKALVPPGLPFWIIPLIFFLEAFTYFVTRPVTLALRLFGNMFAGHLLLLVFTFGGEFLLLHSTAPNKIAGVLSFATAVLMSFFEVLVAFLQAYLFALLAALYIAGSIADEH